jgi:hypothetical protein
MGPAHERRHQSRALLPLHGTSEKQGSYRRATPLYGGLFDLTGISGNPTIGAKVLAGVVHGYFYSGNYSDRSVPFDHLVESYQGDERLSEFMKNTNYRHAGTSVLTGRERNIDTALGLV